MPDALLDVAVAQFGEHGLTATSTRGIAAAAGVAMSTITYRYGGKDGLYRAAARYIADGIGELIRPALATPHLAPVDHIVAVLGRFAGLMLSDDSLSWARFIIREQMQPTEAFDLLWGGIMGEVMAVLARLVGEATAETDPRRVRIITLTLIGQVLVFRAARATVLRALGHASLDGDDVAAIHARLEANIRAILKPSERP